MPPKMPWYEKVLLAPFAFLACLIYGIGIAVITTIWALLCSVFSFLDKKIEESGKDDK